MFPDVGSLDPNTTILTPIRSPALTIFFWPFLAIDNIRQRIPNVHWEGIYVYGAPIYLVYNLIQ